MTLRWTLDELTHFFSMWFFIWLIQCRGMVGREDYIHMDNNKKNMGSSWWHMVVVVFWLWLCLFVLLLMVRRFLIFLFNVGSSWGIGIEFSRNTQILSTHRQRGWGIGGWVAAQNAKIHIWDTNATSWLAKGTQKVAVAIYATTISASCDCASVKGRDKGVEGKKKKTQNKYWATKNKQNTE